jgi:hypothetical protein
MTGEGETGADADPADRTVFGLGNLRGEPPVRVPIHVRAHGARVSAWRIEIACDEGKGAIVLAEVNPGESHYRGEGLCLGWPQEKLAGVYAAARPRGDDDNPSDGPQLG